MKHAYLIVAHRVDKTLNVLLELIDDPRNDIFLHMDRKNKGFCVEQLYPLRHSELIMTDRISVTWGGYSQIRCEMILFEAAAGRSHYDYYHLLSGQDLPVKTQDCIHDFFDKNLGKEFIRFQSPEFEYDDRVRYYYFFQEICGRGDGHLIVRLINSLLLSAQKLAHIHRNPAYNFQKGTNWVSVTDDFVRVLLRSREWIKKTFQYTVCCDEVYKQTVAVNNGFLDRLYHKEFDNDPMAMVRLMDWERGTPYIWTIADKEEILNSQMMFARKFDCSKDESIIHFLRETLVAVK